MINAYVYANDGRRVPAQLQLCGDRDVSMNTDFVFCEAALGNALEHIYREGAPEPARRAQLFGCSCTLNAEGVTGDMSIVRAESKATVRGIYALACRAMPCFARSTRAVWNDLMDEWRKNGMCAYFIMHGERAQGYVLLGDQDEAGTYNAVYEFAKLPCSSISISNALNAVHRAGLCGDNVIVKGSVIKVFE